MNKEQVHTVTEVAAPRNLKRIALIGGTLLAAGAAIGLVVNSRKDTTDETNES